MALTNPTQEFESLISSSELVFLVYFRGHWCPFCMSYLKTLESLTPKIVGAGGTVVVVTAEAEKYLPASRKASGYTGHAIADPAHVLAKTFQAQKTLDVAITDKSGYPNGMAQPAILVMKRKGKGADNGLGTGASMAGELLYSWAIVPSMMNFGGAKDRPDLEQIWENVVAKLAGKPVVHQRYRYTSFFGLMRKKIFG